MLSMQGGIFGGVPGGDPKKKALSEYDKYKVRFSEVYTRTKYVFDNGRPSTGEDSGDDGDLSDD